MECHYVMGIIHFQKNNIPEAIKELLEAQKIFEARGEANHPDCKVKNNQTKSKLFCYYPNYLNRYSSVLEIIKMLREIRENILSIFTV